MRMLNVLTAASIQYLSYRYLGTGKYVYVSASHLCEHHGNLDKTQNNANINDEISSLSLF